MKAPLRLLTPTVIALSLLVANSFSTPNELAVTAKEAANVAAQPSRPAPSDRGQPSQVNRGGTAIATIQFNRPTPPRRGTPGNAGRGGGSRSCLELAKTYPNQVLNGLNALVPEYKGDTSVDVWGLTTDEHPTLWFYVPYSSKSVDSMELTLQDEQGETVQKIPVPMPAQPGIVKVSLPKTEPGLKVGQLYNWFFKVRGNCAENLVVFVEGWIQRQSLDTAVENQLKQASPAQKAAILANQGIWYDALTATANLRLAEPSNTTAWNDLLKGTGMEVLSSQPLVDTQ